MRRKGFTWVELVIVIAIIGILMAMIIPILSALTKRIGEERSLVNLRTDVNLALVAADPRNMSPAIWEYSVPNRWGYSLVKFSDIGLNLGLDGVACYSDGELQQTFSSDSKGYSEKESWDVWQKRYEGIREEIITGFKPGANELFQKQKEN